MKVVLSSRARDYAKSEATYLAAHRPQAARQFADSLKRLMQHLGQFPHMGQVTAEIPIPGVLRFVTGSYLVDYEVRTDTVVILAIRHGQQRPPGVAIDDDFNFETPLE